MDWNWRYPIGANIYNNLMKTTESRDYPWLTYKDTAQGHNMWDWFTGGRKAAAGAVQQGQSLGSYARNTGATGALYTGAYGAQALPLAYSSYLDLLSQQGHIDPREMNQQLSFIQRQSQDTANQIGASAQASGFGRSNLVPALQQAARSAGISKQADVMAKEAADAATRRRQDISMLSDLFLTPMTQWGAIGTNQYNTDRSLNQQQNQNTTNSISQMIASIIGAFA